MNDNFFPNIFLHFQKCNYTFVLCFFLNAIIISIISFHYPHLISVQYKYINIYINPLDFRNSFFHKLPNIQTIVQIIPFVLDSSIRHDSRKINLFEFDPEGGIKSTNLRSGDQAGSRKASL